VLSKIRPYIRTIDSSIDIQAMANGDICVALGYNGDFVQARNRAKEAKNGIQIGYVIPEEGSLLWFDMLAIPRDAPNPANAHLFIDYLMNPQVIAEHHQFRGFCQRQLRGGAAARRVGRRGSDDLSAARRAAAAVRTVARPSRAIPAITRIWQRFKTGGSSAATSDCADQVIRRNSRSPTSGV